MSQRNYGLLDTSNSLAVKNYERAFFRSFNSIPSETLDEILDYDVSNRRLKSKIPYEDQEIYAATIEETVIAAIAVNFNLANPLQLERFGFIIPKNKGAAEGLSIFSLDTATRGTALIELKKLAFSRFAERNIHQLWGTCSERRVRGYQLLGFQIADQRPYKNETKYLIKMECP